MRGPELVLEIPFSRIHADPKQPRRHFDTAALRALGKTIDRNGQAVAVIVRPHPTKSGQYLLIAGERRWRAIRDYCASTKTVRAVVVNERSDARAFRLSFIENEHREDLLPLERAEAMQRLIDDGATQADIADMVGRSATYVNHHLALLGLHPDVRKLLDPAIPERKRLTFTAAVLISRAPRDRQPALAKGALRKDARLDDVRDQVHAVVAKSGKRKLGRPFDGRKVFWQSLKTVERVLRTRLQNEAAVASTWNESGASISAGDTVKLARNVARSITALADQLERIARARAA